MKVALVVLVVLTVMCRSNITVVVSGVPMAIPVPEAAACVIIPATLAAAVLMVRRIARDGLWLAVAYGGAL